MARIKGSPKTGGRKKGSSNKVTAEFKAKIADFLNGKNLETIYGELEEPKDRADFVTKLIPYIVPKQKEVEHKGGAIRVFTTTLNIDKPMKE